jgi:hypothetical protein
MFSNPVAQAVIRPHSAPFILGDFRVTATFGQLDSFHPTPHGGVDIGNGKCGEPLLAMSDGKITLAGKVPGSDALIIRGIDPAHPDYEWAVAHCATVNVVKGQVVHRGDRIGTLGQSGTTACHCHIGLKIKGVSADVWPYLNQNIKEESGMPGFKSVGPKIGVAVMPAAGHSLISPSDTTKFFPQPAGGTFDVYASLDLRTPAGVPVDIGGSSPPQNKRDQVYLVDAPGFGAGAYMLRSDGAFTPVPAGHSDKELADARALGIKAAADAAALVK